MAGCALRLVAGWFVQSRSVMRLVVFPVVALLAALPAGHCAEWEVTEEVMPEPMYALKLEVEKGDQFTYEVHAEAAKDVRTIKGLPISTEKTVLDMKYTITCSVVEEDRTMGFELSYGDYTMVREVTKGNEKMKEVYDVEGLKIYQDGKLELERKWKDVPRSEQAEIRKVLARGYSFAASPRGEIKELVKMKFFEHEAPGFHALRAQQEIYYPAPPIPEGTVWGWQDSFRMEESRDDPLSLRTIPRKREFEFVDTGQVCGLDCVTISVTEESSLEDEPSTLKYERKLTKKAHMETYTGMAVLVEGTFSSEFLGKGLGPATVTSIEGKFSSKRTNPDKEK